MRALTWLLIHAPSTVALAGAERQIKRELDLRALCAVTGDPSPHQRPHGAIVLLLLLTLALVAAYVRTH